MFLINRKECIYEKGINRFLHAGLCDGWRSLRSYVKALKCDPGDEHLYYNLARALYEKGDQEKACRVLKNAIRLNPEFKDGETLLAYYEKHPPQT
ncbi:MAG: tetratricopeptide repeat protein [Deltaproteobacteria bacterium]|nr:tetratricopeptide repeat protein [Deltaproteobacteria bacterium]